MRLNWKPSIVAIFLLLYISNGIFVSSILAYFVPATSVAGRLYLTAVWPAWLLQRPLHYKLPVPYWCFDFSRWNKS